PLLAAVSMTSRCASQPVPRLTSRIGGNAAEVSLKYVVLIEPASPAMKAWRCLAVAKLHEICASRPFGNSRVANVVRSTPESADREMANTRIGLVPVTVRTKLTG